jgi:hypothetical protein
LTCDVARTFAPIAGAQPSAIWLIGFGFFGAANRGYLLSSE